MRKLNLRKTLSRTKMKVRRVIHKIQGKQFVHFLHITKTGGSAIKYALNKHSPDSRFAVFYHPHNVRLSDIPVGESVVFFLRDPISRFSSGFYSRQRKGQPRYFVPWSPNEKIAFETFSTPNQLALALSSADDEMRNKACMAMKAIQHLRSSYWIWFGNADYFKSRMSDILFIGFQERFSQDFEKLKSKLGYPDNVVLPSDDTDAHRNPKNLDTTLDDEAIANLKDWYQDDFRLFGLCKEIRERLDVDPLAFKTEQGAFNEN